MIAHLGMVVAGMVVGTVAGLLIVAVLAICERLAHEPRP